jgi:hypothetical protein
VHGVGREGGQTDRGVLGTVGLGRAVAHPLAGVRDRGLPAAHDERSLRVRDVEAALRKSGGRVDVPGRGLVGVKGNSPF